MTRLLDFFIVGLVLLASIVHAFIALGPKSLRRWRAAGPRSKGGACSDCGNCRSASGPGRASRPAAVDAPAAEAAIPLHDIGRRARR